MQKSIFNKYISLVIVLIICTTIFYFSHQNGVDSAKVSNNIIIRKLGHISEYALLSFFTSSFISNYAKNKKLIFTYSIMFVVFFATTDEIHQFFVIGRSAKFTDIIIDSVGGIIGVIIYLAMLKLFNNLLSKK